MNYIDRQERLEALQERPGFTKDQLRKLVREVDANHTHTRDFEGRKLSYIEGWYAIAQANAIFGYAGWDREMVHFERVLERARGDTVTCGYIARVRIRVRAGSSAIIREGTGWGSASATQAAPANERALKAAETDATKRALSTFGPRFGLSLYDKERVAANQRPTFTLFAPDGRALANDLSAEGYCSGLRQMIEVCRDARAVDDLTRHNRSSISDLRVYVPSLRNDQGTHFADLLLRLLRRRAERLNHPHGGNHLDPAMAVSKDARIERQVETDNAQTGGGNVAIGSNGTETANINADLAPADMSSADSSVPGAATGPVESGPSLTLPAQTNRKIDKSQLRLGLERRLRDKDHLKRVAELPCLICSRQPSHAHHLRFAQRRGLSQKVSDEYVVPLCALHHGDLHHSSSEQDWWAKQKVDPIPVAMALWTKHH